MRSPLVRRVASAALALALFSAGAARAESVWIKACFHAHERTSPSGLHDDGSDTAAHLVARLVAAGFDVGVHTPHSHFNRQHDPAVEWRSTESREERLGGHDILFDTGEELTVASGGRYHGSYRILGHVLGGNLDHLSLIGIDHYVPDGATIEQGCEAAHEAGGFCVVNHPGPGPMQWEPRYWEQPAHRHHVDALEVYNGQAYAALGLTYEERYLDATAYGGSLGGLKLAAEAAPDTHGAARVPILREQVAGLGLLAHTLGAVPIGDPAGLELGASTMVLVDAGPDGRVGWRQIDEAVLARRTVAVFGFPRLELDCPGLGQTLHTADVSLHLGVGRKVARITLYEEGRPVATWRNVASASYHGHLTHDAAFVWGIVDGTDRAMTSAVWFEPSR